MKKIKQGYFFINLKYFFKSFRRLLLEIMRIKKNVNIKSYKNVLYNNIIKINHNWLYLLSKNNVLTKHTFEILILSKPTAVRLLEQSYTHMTKVQSLGIPFQICGFDLLGSARTGSGKTIAFSIPLIEFVHTVKWLSKNGTAVIVLSPTRELTLQSYYVTRDLLIYHSHSYGILMGGANKNTEEQKIKKGISIVTATPGRLLDHLATNANFLYKNLQLLIIDEADRCLEIGFEEEMYQIINTLPKNRQTVLFSATQTKNIQSLSRVSFKKEPIYLGVDDMSVNSSIPEIDQNFLICRPEDRFIILISLLKKNITSKIIVFFSSCNEVKFFSNLANLIGLNVLDLHGKQKQFKRSSTFFDFCKAKNSILFSTDIASRGLDIPSVDWIFHLDAPLEAKEYFHRVGRTCRGINSFGKSLIFLLPTEINFLKFLENNKIKINEYKFRVHDWSIIHYRISNLIEQNSYLIKMAKEALRSFLNSYSSSNMKEVFDIKKINLNSLSKNFGLNTKSNLIL